MSEQDAGWYCREHPIEELILPGARLTDEFKAGLPPTLTVDELRARLRIWRVCRKPRPFDWIGSDGQPMRMKVYPCPVRDTETAVPPPDVQELGLYPVERLLRSGVTLSEEFEATLPPLLSMLDMESRLARWRVEGKPPAYARSEQS